MSEPTTSEKALTWACQKQQEKIKAHELAVSLLVAGGFLAQEKYDQALDMAQQFLPEVAAHD